MEPPSMSEASNKSITSRRGRGNLRGVLARVLVGACLAAGAVSMTAMTVSPPEPEAIPRRWQLDLEPGALRLATVDVPGVGKKAYFYFTYQVVNNSGEDMLFAPAFELATERGAIRSGLDVPVAVTRKLIEQTQNTYMEDQISIIGQLLQGKENAKDGIVIWPADELDMDELVLYAAGFSGETATVVKPTSKEPAVLRKSYMIEYHVSGDMTEMIGKEIPREMNGHWIMR